MLRTISSLLALLLFSVSVLAESAYVSDNLFSYMHTGPGTDYKILGSINAGKIVSLTGKTSDGFSKVVDERGRQGWVKTSALQSEPSFRYQVEQLQQQLENEKQNLLSEQGVSESLRDELAALNGRYESLQEKLNATIEQLNTNKVEVFDSDEAKILWFSRGAIVLGVGLLIGIIIPFLPRRKKRAERWM